MLVKNIGSKIIGFGKLMILPGDSALLPAEYSEKHPVVGYYLQKGYLEACGKAAAPVKAKVPDPVKAKVPPEPINPEEPEPELPPESELPDAIAVESADPEPAPVRKAFADMDFDELKAEARTLGVKFSIKDSREILLEKLSEYIPAE